jgi:hypothetical protein
MEQTIYQRFAPKPKPGWQSEKDEQMILGD